MMEWVNEWAKFRATDENGEVFEYENRPEQKVWFWHSVDQTALVYTVSYDRNWKNSLEERDMAKEEWNDGLPGVGVVCEVHMSGDEWQQGKCVGHDSINTVNVAVVRIGADTYIAFTTKCLRPIKKREPKPGEVWMILNNPCVFRDSPNEFKFVQLGGKESFDIKIKHEYAAPSVKAYIARELLNEGNLMGVFDHLNLLTKAARLDEE